MNDNLQLLNETPADNLLIRSFIHTENRKQADERIITDVKKILADVKIFSMIWKIFVQYQNIK